MARSTSFVIISCLSFTVSSVCSSPTQDTTSIISSIQLIISVMATFLLACIGTFVLSSLFYFLVMKRFLKAQAQLQLQVAHDIVPTERMYEMMNTENATDAEVLDNDSKSDL